MGGAGAVSLRSGSARAAARRLRARLEAQLSKIDQLAERDGFDWMVGELDIFTFGYLDEYTIERGCVADPKSVFLPIRDETLAQLLAAPRRPSAAYFMAGPAEWADDMTLRGQLSTRLHDFAAALKE